MQSVNSNRIGNGKKKIVIKKKQDLETEPDAMVPSLSFRLIDFSIYDQNVEAQATGEEPQHFQARQNKKMVIQIFGINELGETCALFVEDMNPFFYVLVPDTWNEYTKKNFIGSVTRQLRLSDDAIVKDKCAIVKKRKLYGFDGGKQHNFIVLYFKNLAMMNKVKNLWYISSENAFDLNPDGYNYNGTSLKIYESNIPPLLRFFHMNEISPSGWIEFSKCSATEIDASQKTTSCMHEYVIGMKDIKPQPTKEVPVPYKICSFDIEASSSHGDFPLAVKTYKKLATNIVDVCISIQKDDGAITDQLIEKMIRAGFFGTQYDNEYIDGNIQKVFTKRRMFEKQVKPMLQKFISEKIKNLNDETGNKYANANTIEAMFEKIGKKNAECFGKGSDENDGGDNDDDNNDNDNDNDNGDNESSHDAVTMNIVEEVTAVKTNHYHQEQPLKLVDNEITVLKLLQSTSMTREMKITHLNTALSSVFPEVEGDKVTFIGSTFLKAGDERPYLNHCLTIDTCDAVPNSEIQVCESEYDMLLEWTKVIQREDPDIIIGYNIFGFDYNFMFHRALENDCGEEFLKLSRNKDQMCGQYDQKTNKLSIEESTLVIASGEYNLHYIKIAGRLQIDMFNYLRRDYSMSSYKLDYVSGYFIGDGVKGIQHSVNESGDDVTIIQTGNVMGLEVGSYINFEETSNSTELYKGGEKFKIIRLDVEKKTFEITGKEMPNMEKKVRWGLAKDDVSPQDIFRMTHEGPSQRAIIAKYCIQDCNLVHHLMRKIDVLTGFVEMANICSVPMSFLVFRGQGIKLTSFIAKKCREKNTLIPVLERKLGNESYDGAIVLPPKCNLYLDNPVACVDYSSLYPSSMISENLSHDSKVWTKEYDLNGIMVKSTGERNEKGEFIYDNLPGYDYVDVEYDTYVWKKNERGKAIKTVSGKKVCRFAQPLLNEDGSNGMGEKAIMPSILEELLAARSATRKLAAKQTDDFMKNVLDKRQLGYKVTANSLYGQCGAKTSSFYEIDVAASTTATGRKLLLYAKRVVEETYGDTECETECHGVIKTRAEYVYGDTDSVFFTFNLTEKDGTPIRGKKALEITIELAQQVGELASSFLKAPHSLVYEKSIMPFCLLRKKGYVGIYYETNANKGSRKSMGIVLKRRDNAPIVKDVYGGIIDILMKEQNTERAISFLKNYLQDLIDEKIPLEKLIITKSLNSNYKNPQQIAQKVLADRMGQRDPGNKPSVGDRVPYVYIHNSDKKALQGDHIEHPVYMKQNGIKPDYAFYITNQIMKPVQQLFALVLENIPGFKRRKETLNDRIELESSRIGSDNPEALQTKITKLRENMVKELLFDEFLIQATNAANKNRSIKDFFKRA